MNKSLSLTLLGLAISAAFPALSAPSFVGSNEDPSANTIIDDITIDANRYLTYTYEDKSEDYGLFGIFPNNQSVSFTGQNIAINVKARNLVEKDSREPLQGVGADVLSGSKLTLGSAGSHVSFNIDSDSMIMGIRSGTNSYVEINGDRLDINAESLGTTPETGSVYGLYAQNSSNDPNIPVDERATLVVNAENTFINVKSASEDQAAALVAMSQGILRVNGNLYATGGKAIVARGNAIIRINESNTKTVQLTGDIDFNYDKKTSGTTVDADVLLNLSGADSFWHGSATTSYGSGSTSEDMMAVSGLRLGISNGAHWTPNLVEEYQGETSGLVQTAINDLSFNDGVINLEQGREQNIHIERLSGTGGTVNLTTETNDDGSLSTARMIVDHVNAEATPELAVHYTGITADDMVGSKISDIEGGVQAPGAEQTRTVAQGAVMGAITEKVNAQGEVYETTQAENTRLNAYGSVASLGILQWRHEMNDLTKRMGELRTSSEGVGAWARLYGSEQEYGSQNVTNKNTSIQVGADFDVGSGWKVGAAFTYTDGSSDYDAGKADNKGYGFGVYGTWVSESGQFVDLIAKYHRLDTDFQLEGMDGSYDNNAFSVSAEYGWHFKLGEAAFIEPQAEITYGRLTGDDFATSNGVRVQQDDFDSLVGRIGVRAGFSFPNDKGTIYARVSGLHDFQGDFDSKASLVNNAAVSQNIHEDLGDTWVEFGVGANFNWTENTYTYIDLERSNGGEIKENWRWNVGVRHVF